MKKVIHTGMAGMKIFLLIMTLLMSALTVAAFRYVKEDVVFVGGALIALTAFFGVGCFISFNARVVLDEELGFLKLYFMKIRTISIREIKEINVWKVPKSEVRGSVYSAYRYVIVHLKEGETQKLALYGTERWLEYIEDQIKWMNKEIQTFKGEKNETE